MEFFKAFIGGNEIVYFFQLTLSAVLGLIIGVEREHIGKAAGKRTFALVSLGSCLYTVISIYGFAGIPGTTSFDPSRIAGQIVVGIGFLGAGLIIFEENRVKGLTTSAALWASSAVGVAVGIQFYSTAIFSAMLIFFILAGLRHMARVE